MPFSPDFYRVRVITKRLPTSALADGMRLFESLQAVHAATDL